MNKAGCLNKRFENDVLFSNDTGVMWRKEGRRFDSCWENSEFLFPSMPVSLLNNTSFSFIHQA